MKGGTYTPQQIVDQINKAVSDAVTNMKKTLAAGAIDSWLKDLLTFITQKLKNDPMSNWDADSPKVLRVAKDMGTIAAILAGDGPQVSKNMLQAAFAACKTHAVCPTPGPGSGAWCDF